MRTARGASERRLWPIVDIEPAPESPHGVRLRARIDAGGRTRPHDVAAAERVPARDVRCEPLPDLLHGKLLAVHAKAARAQDVHGRDRLPRLTLLPALRHLPRYLRHERVDAVLEERLLARQLLLRLAQTVEQGDDIDLLVHLRSGGLALVDRADGDGDEQCGQHEAELGLGETHDRELPHARTFRAGGVFSSMRTYSSMMPLICSSSRRSAAAIWSPPVPSCRATC